MTLRMDNNHFPKGKHRILFVLLLLFLVLFECESIKFAKKQAEKKPTQTVKQNVTPKTENENKDQQTSSKPQQSPAKANQQPKKQSQKHKQVKPQVISSSPATSVPKPQQALKPSTDKSLDSLFGQSTQIKAKQITPIPSSTPVMKITAEEHKKTTSTPVSSVTPVTNSQAQQKKPQTNSMIGGLFVEEKSAKPQKADSIKEDKPLVSQAPKVQQEKQPVKPKIETKTETASVEPKEQKTEQKNEKVDKQPAKTQSKEEAKKQRKQEQSSGDVYYPGSKKTTQKEDEPKKAEKKTQTIKNSDKQDEADLKSHTKTDKQQQSSSEQILYPSKSTAKASKKISKPHSSTQQENPQDIKRKYSLTLFLTFCLYSLIIVLVVITIKCTSSSNKVVKAVRIMVDALGDMFKKKQGYRPALNEEEVTQREEEITVGYNVEDNNKQIFWEKNSVEGI